MKKQGLWKLVFTAIVPALLLSTAAKAFAREDDMAAGTGQESGEAALLSPDIAEIMERGTLRVAIPGEDLTAFFQEDGEGNLYGIDIELAESIAES